MKSKIVLTFVVEHDGEDPAAARAAIECRLDDALDEGWIQRDVLHPDWESLQASCAVLPSRAETLVSLEKFLSRFLDDAKTWAQATAELPDMYDWMRRFYNMLPGGDVLAPVGRENCGTPAVWNTLYKAAIRTAFAKFSDDAVDLFRARFEAWLERKE